MRYFSIYIDKTNDFYTYSTEDESIGIGDRVIVKFRNKDKVGLVVKEEIGKEYKFKVLKIVEKLYTELSFSKKFIELLLWIKEYYLTSFEQVFTTAVPSGLKIKYDDIYILNEEIDFKLITNEITEYFKSKEKIGRATLVKKFGKDIIKDLENRNILKKEGTNLIIEKMKECPFEITEYFKEKKEIGKQTVDKKFDKKLIEKMLKNKELLFIKKIKKFEEEKFQEKIDEYIERKDVTLNEKQQEIKDEIEKSNKKYHLIRGVTGSGKTEVYIQLIKNALRRGKGSIFLVPEISLTPQMVIRFKNEFGNQVAILHSKLTGQERAKEWYSIYTGEKKIVLGVRSAIFAPVQNLEYIIIDEEHENSYKQDSSPRYHAKYVGIKRVELENAKIVLGSATPDIENYYFAKNKVFQLYELETRYKNANLPMIEIVDMKDEKDSFFSEKLLKSIRETVLKGEQVILLLNRKGYSTLIQCEECGHMEECEHCSIKLNYYASNGILKCNYCGIAKKFTGRCSSCGSSKLSYSGRGVERVEEELKKRFDLRVIRVDGESGKQKNFYENMYNDFLSQKYDVMIGTQMVSRGLHFPNVTLVGVINADTVMSIPDYRSGERTYQMITQVAGRAGRGEKKGKVIIQTYQPENYIIEKIQEHSYNNFYEKEIEKRELLSYPPYSKLINIGISSENEAELENYANSVLETIQDDDVEIYGPIKSLVYKVKSRYRYNILIKGSRNELNRMKKDMLEKLKKIERKGYRIVVDVDPVNLI